MAGSEVQSPSLLLHMGLTRPKLPDSFPLNLVQGNPKQILSTSFHSHIVLVISKVTLLKVLNK